MKETRLKYIFFISSAILLLLMLLSSRDAGITCDEVLHYNQSVSVYNYFATKGTDQSALITPVTHLKYYGQSYDNLATIFAKWFNVDDIYSFRHFMSSFAGWLTILITALLAVWLEGYGTGIIVLILFAASPTFIGHSQNNLKDIPFALAYISGTFFTLKFLGSGRKINFPDILFLILSIAFSISIRAGGLLLICYLFFFFILFFMFKYLKEKNVDIIELRNKLLWIMAISAVSLLLSTLLWPFALQNPLKNVFESYHVMAHFPDTFRQIFEGKVEWSDYMPWYYLAKSMFITIPVVVLAGIVLFIIFSGRILKRGKIILYGLLVFTVLFPLIFVIYENSNLYSSWRQFLFLYPAIVLLASVGFVYYFKKLKASYFKWFVVIFIALLSAHPLKFMIKNHPYYYLYYNQFVGGLKGAYTNYETDYYYTSQTKASEWLIDYLKDKSFLKPLKVKATYSVQWMFRNHSEIETSYFRYDERSQTDWDYAIIVNRYISPYKLKNNPWPPDDAIHTIYVDSVPVCTIIKRQSKDDFYGFTALSEGLNSEAIAFYEKALMNNVNDELIFYNFARALYNIGEYHKADSVLKMGLTINPDFEPILMYLGNIAKSKNNTDEAILYYERVILANRKYFEAYVGLSDILTRKDVNRARALLRTCLTMNPVYKPAIIALADTYRKSNPDIAEKYDELANSIN
jgi:tetratricopeptide (TPR) repeat protein